MDVALQCVAQDVNILWLPAVGCEDPPHLQNGGSCVLKICQPPLLFATPDIFSVFI